MVKTEKASMKTKGIAKASLKAKTGPMKSGRQGENSDASGGSGASSSDHMVTSPGGTRNSVFCQHDSPGAEAMMRAAAASAEAGVQLEHGGPFGASVVKNGIIISCAHNTVLMDKDPTCHGEMNAIRYACNALQSHDLSDCELYTTCEPCPMCWGAIQWSRVSKVFIGVDRYTAARYGFDDKVFYDEIESQAGHYGLHRYGFLPDNKAPADKKKLQALERAKEGKQPRLHKNMLDIYDGVLKTQVEELFTNTLLNKTYRRRLGSGKGFLGAMYDQVFPEGSHSEQKSVPVSMKEKPGKVENWQSSKIHTGFMQKAVDVALAGAREGSSKEREPFGAVIVKGGQVIASASNSVMKSRDATATAEVNAIRMAARNLGTYDLSECTIYCTVTPDLMSLGACLWARIKKAYCGVSQQLALKCGHEEGWLHFKELLDTGADDRVIQVVEKCAAKDCEAVFQKWSSLQGKIY